MSDLYIPDLATDDFGEFVQGLANNFSALEDGTLNYNPASPASDWEPTKVAEALDVLAESRIIEYGSNENGEYWRWENRLQICFGVYQSQTSIEINEPWGQIYMSETLYVDFPAAFVSTPAFKGWNGSVYSTLVANRGASGTRVDRAGFCYVRGSVGSLSGSAAHLYFVAIGEW